MSRATGLVVLAGLAAAWGAGCAPQHSTPTAAGLAYERRAVGPDLNFEKVWRATAKVLRSYHFVLDRQDRRAGVITTKPLLGRHFFEVWRRDAVTFFDMTEGTLQTIYRTVTVKIVPGPTAGTFEPRVEVQVSRSDREVVGAPSVSSAYNTIFSPGRKEHKEGLLVGKTEASRRNAPDPVGLGQQKSFADRLAAEIRREANLVSPPPRPSAPRPAAPTAPATGPSKPSEPAPPPSAPPGPRPIPLPTTRPAGGR